MAAESSKRDPNYVSTLMGVDMTTGLLPTKVYVDESTHRLLVDAAISSGSITLNGADGAITDGASSSIRASVLDLTGSNGLAVAIVDSSGNQISSFGGGTQYTEGDTDATITGTALLWEDTSDTLRAVSAAKPLPVNIVAGSSSGTEYTEGDIDASITGTAFLMEVGSNTLQPVQGTVADGLLVNLGANNDVTITGTVAVTDNAGSLTVDAPVGTPVFVRLSDGASAISTLPVSLASVPSHNVTNAGTFAVQVDGSALTALQLIDDTIATLGTTTYTEAATKGSIVGAVRRDADTTLVDTTNEIAPLIVDARGFLKVEIFAGETIAVSATDLDIRNLVAATDTITIHGDVGVIDQLDLTNSNPAVVAIVDANGDQITSFGGGTQYTEDAAAAANPVGNMLIAVREDGRAGSLTSTDGDNVALRANNFGELYVKHTDSIAVTNSGLTELAGAINASAQMDVNIAAQGVNLTVNSHNVTNAGTFAVQVDGAALTSLQLLDDTVAVLGTDTYTEATSKGLIMAAVRRDADTTLVNTTNEYTPLQVDANGRLKVEAFSGETLPVSLTSTTITGQVTIGDGTDAIDVLAAGADNVANTDNQLITAAVLYAYDGAAFDRVTIGGGTEATALRVTLASDSTGLVSVDDNGASLSVDWNGTQPVTGSGTATGALRVELPTNGTGVLATVGTVTTVSTLTGGGVASGAGDSGNPVKVGGRVETALSTATMEADGDRIDLLADADGALLVRPNFPLGDLLTDATSNTDGASTASAVFTATASTRNVITAIHVFRTDAGTTPIFIDFRDGTAGAVLWRMVLPPNGGSIITDPTGLFRTTANTALAYDVSAATTTVYINVSGFKSKV